MGIHVGALWCSVRWLLPFTNITGARLLLRTISSVQALPTCLACYVQAFQKLIYVSNRVFGEAKAAFLLPWKRVFGLSDAQLYVARRDNARALFKSYLAASGGCLPVRESLISPRIIRLLC